ncbi:MAG: cell division protein ZapA [Myxococcota bacterium]
MAKRKVEVSLLGRNFSIKSDQDEAHVHQVAALVNRKYEELRHQSRSAPPQDLLVLVALNLADELVQREAQARATRADIRARGQRVLQTLNAALSEGADGDVHASARASQAAGVAAQELFAR